MSFSSQGERGLLLAAAAAFPFASRNHLLRLRGSQSRGSTKEGLRLIDQAIYSTYCDAVDVGVTDEAQRLLHRSAVPAGE